MNNPITVETTINATMESVWKLWNTPVDISQWNNPSDYWQPLKVTNDLIEGGEFLLRMQAKDGSDAFDFGGKYDKVIVNELIAFTLSDVKKNYKQIF